ncbi:MAG: hypothetical protein ACXADS_14030 [Candidatus Thorarchaeota archaeon]
MTDKHRWRIEADTTAIVVMMNPAIMTPYSSRCGQNTDELM